MAAGTWVKLEQKGEGPGARSSHAIAMVGDTAYAFGGEFTPRVPVDNTMYAFDLTTQRWSPLAAAGDVPPPRVGVTMASVGATVYMFGGREERHKELGELYAFDTATATWTLLSTGGGDDGPPRRSYHSMVADAGAGKVYVFGGCGEGGRLNDLWAYDVGGGRWEAMPSPGESCKPRGGPGLAVAGGGKVWVVYGFSGEELDDVHCYDTLTGAWCAVETTGEKPSPRSVFCGAGIGKHVVVFGGEVDPSDMGHLGAGKFSGEAFALDTETGEWARLGEEEEGQHPGARGWCAFAAGEVDGRRGMLVYGGNSPTNDRLGDIYFFTPPLPSS
uniref:Nitrile-specifier protein 5 n=1 Tax=Leersia perrieri TaxID=77586 RepID=A0A0D9XBK8_9ORYZ